MQDRLDIVATQGAYLIPRARTPVFLFEKPYDAKFAAVLEQEICALITGQIWRRAMYGGAADEWPMGHTPPELKEEYKAKVKAQEELDGVSSEGSDNDNNGNNIGAGLGPRKVVTRQADRLPTPPLSESPLTPLRNKRWRISEEGDEVERPTKTRISSATKVSAGEDAVSKASHCNGRKRRRTVDVGERKEESTEPPAKVRITTTGLSSRWRQRLRPRPSADRTHIDRNYSRSARRS